MIEEENVAEEPLSWEDLGVLPNIVKCLKENQLNEPSPIQKCVIKCALAEKCDVLVAAPTGSGKTLAFGIPLIQAIYEKRKTFGGDKLRGLVLTPTRELALQIKSHLDKIAADCGIKIAVIVGGLSLQKQERIVNKDKPDIVVATPGRLWQFVNDIESPHVNYHSLSHTRFLIIDEADRMTEKGYFAELHNILATMKERGSSIIRQVFVVSATLTFIHKGQTTSISNRKKPSGLRQRFRYFAKLFGMKNERKIFDLTEGGIGTPGRDRLVFYKIDCLKEDKDLFLYYFIIKTPGKSLIFCNSKNCLRRLVSILKLLQLYPIPLHGSMDQKRRLVSLEKFKKNPQSVLLASDVAARGLDISDIDHVIHYQVPRSSEIYIHRSGRTARMMNKGLSLILCEPKEKYAYMKLCDTINEGKEIASYDVNERQLNMLRERIRLACRLDKLCYGFKKQKNESNFFKLMAKKCDIDLEDRDDLVLEDNQPKKQISQLEKQLYRLIKQPLPFD